VASLGSSTRVNAACLDLQKQKPVPASDAPSAARREGGAEGGCGCPFLDEGKRLDLRDAILAEVADIEDVVALGRKTGACPYYSARAAVRSAQLVTLPYTSLVHKGTREALGVSLKGNVVVIDEAHNLVEAINNVHSATLSEGAATMLATLFSDYLDRFATRLSPKTAGQLKQVLLLVKSLANFMRAVDKTEAKPEAAAAAKSAGSALLDKARALEAKASADSRPAFGQHPDTSLGSSLGQVMTIARSRSGNPRGRRDVFKAR